MHSEAIIELRTGVSEFSIQKHAENCGKVAITRGCKIQEVLKKQFLHMSISDTDENGNKKLQCKPRIMLDSDT
jgi:hypothetical protein